MTLNDSILYEISQALGSKNMRFNEPMAPHLTMQVGGPARYYFTPEGEDALCRLVKILNREGCDYFILGSGSNLIVRDEGYDGIIISMEKGFDKIEVYGNYIIAGAGAMLRDVSAAALEANLSGFEFACGIPGSTGGGVSMNAGAYGGEMKDVVKEVKGVTGAGRFEKYENWEMRFGYRHSICADMPLVITEAIFELSPGKYSEIKEKMADLTAQRRAKQPLEYPSCGSTFKRPKGYFAGKLIMDSGLAGYSIGGAQVSTKHCGFVINKGGATAADVLSLIEYIKKTVYERQEVRLECEVKIL